MSAPFNHKAGFLIEKGADVLKNGFNIIPVRPNTKAPSVKGWESSDATETQLEEWISSGMAGHGIGILTKRTPFGDLDIQHDGCLRGVIEWAELHIGWAPVRIGNAPKCGMLFRLKNGHAPFRKISSRIYTDLEGNKAQLEILADGQQFVAFHIHPDTGKQYKWLRGESPATVNVNDLPEITERRAEEWVAYFEQWCESHGWQRYSSPMGSPAELPDFIDADDVGDNSNEPCGLDEETIRARLMAIPNDERFDPREDWLKIGFGVHHETGDSEFGRELFLEWSEQHPSHKEELFDKAWSSFGKRRNDFRNITFRYILKLAKEFDDTRPKILVQGGELPRMVDEAEAALIAGGAPIYSRGQYLVRPVVETVDAAYGRKTKVARLVPMSEAGLADWFAKVAKWARFDARAKKLVSTDPPPKVAAILLSRDGYWQLAPLIGVITTPTIREDGSLLTEQGYDSQTRLLLMQPPPMPPIPERPTRRQAKQALALIGELLKEYPFVDDVSRSVAFSALMTPVARGALPVAPLHLARAPVPGSGKSHLMSTASAIATGQICPVITAARYEEMEKRLGACLLAGQPIICIDNLNGELEGDFLCQAVEQRRVQVRILGKSETVTIETRTTIFATGNNLIVKGDLVRRTLVLSLDPELERPELREFEGDPLEQVLSDRGRYVAAVLTIIRAYLAAGEPGLLRPLASFEQWSRLIRSPLVWLGCADPVDSIEQSRAEDPVMNTLRLFLNAWRDEIGTGYEHGKTAAEIVAMMHSPLGFDDDPASGVATSLCTVGSDPHRIGNWLRRHRGRIVDGLKLTGREDASRKIVVWYVERASRKSSDFDPL